MDELTNTRLYTDVCSIIEQGRKEAYASVNHKMIETYCNIGRRIVEEEQNGEARAEYGVQIIAQLSEQLTHQYGKEFSKRNLAYFRQFYLTISDIRILQSRLQNLTWTHITKVLRVEDSTAIRWYFVFVLDIPYTMLKRICNPSLSFPYGKRKVKVAEMFGDLHDFVYFAL